MNTVTASSTSLINFNAPSLCLSSSLIVSAV